MGSVSDNLFSLSKMVWKRTVVLGVGLDPQSGLVELRFSDGGEITKLTIDPATSDVEVFAA